MGTWKLDEVKSWIPTGFMKDSTVVYTADGDKVKVTTDGTDKDGKPIHTEWTGKFDGKEYPLAGDPTADSRSYKTINERELEIISRKSGKITNSGKVEVSKDGKTRTLNLTGTDSSGKKVPASEVRQAVRTTHLSARRPKCCRGREAHEARA